MLSPGRIDLLDVWRPGSGLTWRRLAVLVKALAKDPASHTHAAIGGPAFTLDQFLLADIRSAWGGIANPWRADLEKKHRSARARELVARQEAWNNRKRG